ncbi:MAG TPA: TonB family protein [Pyrinomonadaceae bacterium]|nr:TonB family protein [Pyrinomonadaceae bacterium]
MFTRLTRLPALVLFPLLLLNLPASAQDKKGEPARPPQPAFGIGPGDPTPGPTPGPDGPFRAKEVAKRAVLNQRPEPDYTEEARLNDVEGVVRLRAVLSSSGQVTNISIIKGLPDGLTEKAIAAARLIKFTPAQKNGRPVSQYVVIEYHFTIYEDEDRVDRKAVILEQPDPGYTPEALAHLVEGKVVLDVFLYKDGRAPGATVVGGLPHGLSQKAVEAAEKIKYTPARLKGRPVNVVRRIEYAFSLKRMGGP